MYRKLTRQIKEETSVYSSVSLYKDHPAILEMIQMGKPAIPLIIEDLKNNHPDISWWCFYVIDQIAINERLTRVTIPLADAGRWESFRQAYLRWAKRHHLDQPINS